MTLQEIPLPEDTAPLPGDVDAFLREADGRIDELMATHRNKPIAGFVPSDFELVYRALRTIDALGLATGAALCEWGSGFGVVTCLAAMADFDACGIEINFELIEAAERLAEDFELPVDFVHGSFIPTGADAIADTVAESAWLALGGHDAYEHMGLGPEDFDVIFAYPWPGEQQIIEELFDQYAAVGALLLTYNGLEGLRLRRKTAPAEE